MPEIKVLIIDDSKVIRNTLKIILDKKDRINIIGEAENGEEGYRKILELNPDIVLLDINMPVMDGLTLLKKLRKNRVFAKVIVLSTLTKAGSRTAVQAMNLGALEFIHKPEGNIETAAKGIIEIIIQINDIKERRFLSVPSIEIKEDQNAQTQYLEKLQVKTENIISQNHKFYNGEIEKIFSAKSKRPKPKLIAIGISTGGPRALNIILATLPKKFALPIVIVQHMQDTFITEFIKILQHTCAIKIDIAENEKKLETGVVYFAPGKQQTGVVFDLQNNLIFSVKENLPVSGHMPSVDYLYSSIHDSLGGSVIAVIMTGMGSDGAKSMLKLSEKNAITIAQDEASSTVFGMPKSAISLNAVDLVLPLEEIFPFITKLLEKKFVL